ncbi:hypothetical protein [Alkalimarinus alittae]|uniref:Uncharacterized protein n=1 Tax=Alkalimarinus alittae TaxID=2961619 RepID=A0ABY6N564_9ALTE|nr:hypothetical protein [Alkalimarinus alittae]UZE97114.1 hypothetical protein NKI27_05030 [Alkalimarinus alittae]
MNLETINTLLPFLLVIPLAINVLLMVKVTNLKKQIKSSHAKTLALLEFLRKQQSRTASIKAKQALVEKTVNSSTVAVESIHQSISDAAFNVINNLSSKEKTKTRNQKLRELHDQTSSDVYKSVKVVNKQVGVITEAFLSTRKSTRATPSDKQPTPERQVHKKRSKRLDPNS